MGGLYDDILGREQWDRVAEIRLGLREELGLIRVLVRGELVKSERDVSEIRSLVKLVARLVELEVKLESGEKDELEERVQAFLDSLTGLPGVPEPAGA